MTNARPNYASIVSNIQVVGLSRALDFRRSFNSQKNSDSAVNFSTIPVIDSDGSAVGYTTVESVCLGPRDKKRLSDLVKAGDSHGKSTRFIDVYFNLTLPRRVWVDMDTYRLGKVEGLKPDDIEYFSDSTMHTLTKTDLGPQHFAAGTDPVIIGLIQCQMAEYRLLEQTEPGSEKQNELFILMKNNLPEGFIQTRSVKTNYQALRHIYKDRHNHRQPEFRWLCEWIETLPFAKELIVT